jgi:hypothetical protein
MFMYNAQRPLIPQIANRLHQWDNDGLKKGGMAERDTRAHERCF